MNTEQERTEFEAWYRLHHGSRDVYGRDASGEYTDKSVQGSFNVWLARAALTAQPAAFDTTHSFVCWGWGPKHYECAVRQVKELQEALTALKAENEMLREALKDADNELDWLDGDMDTCDHSVGVCMCDYWNMRRKMKAALAKERAMKVEAPERIWIESEGECPYFYHEEELSDVAPPITEYVRADKLEELAAETEALRTEVDVLKAENEALRAEVAEWKKSSNDMADACAEAIRALKEQS